MSRNFLVYLASGPAAEINQLQYVPEIRAYWYFKTNTGYAYYRLLSKHAKPVSDSKETEQTSPISKKWDSKKKVSSRNKSIKSHQVQATYEHCTVNGQAEVSINDQDFITFRNWFHSKYGIDFTGRPRTTNTATSTTAS